MKTSIPLMQSELAFRNPSPEGRETAPPSKSLSAPVSSLCSPAAEDTGADVPLLRRVPSGSRRRRAVSESYLPSSSSLSRRRSFGRDVGHAAAETFLLTRLTLILLRYLGVGYRWMTKFLALVCYAILLMPGFLQVGYYYFFSSQVRRSIIYGDQPRNRLDLYLPTDVTGSKPVVAFVTGGAWIIGYKAWGTLLGRRLAERGIIVACIDYRNFPQGTISDMVKDASAGISFVCNNIVNYGGDPKGDLNRAEHFSPDLEMNLLREAIIPISFLALCRIYLMGQSAGAHIAACALVHQAIKEFGEGDNISWSVSQIKAYFGLSGGYNMLNLVDHFHKRGLYRSIFLSIMEGEQSLRHFSPEVVVRDLSARCHVPPLPPIVLYHGTGDYSIPSDASTTFAEALQRIGVQAEVVLFEGKTHTDLFLQALGVDYGLDPCAFELVIRVLLAWIVTPLQRLHSSN